MARLWLRTCILWLVALLAIVLSGGARVASAQGSDPWLESLFLPAVIRSQALPIEVHTVIITDASSVARYFEFGPDDPDLLEWLTSLEQLASRPEVAAVLVQDLDTDADARVAAAYAAWSAHTDPTLTNGLANRLAEALRDWIWTQKATRWPELRHIVIAGDDRVVPHYRLRIDPPSDSSEGWATERDYLGDDDSIGAGTTIGAALAADLTLNDDYYAVPSMLPWDDGARAIPLPELAVGRLVERPAHMTAVVDAYLERPRLPVSRTLLAGYDFMQDALEAVEPALAARLPAQRRVRLIGPGWRDRALHAALFDTRPDLVLLALHASHYHAETPNNGVLLARDVAESQADLRGMLVIALACHAGLNAPGPDHAQPLDFPEAWLRQGASFVGSPGWAFGGDRKAEALRYQEALTAGFAEGLLVEGGVAVGEALAAAKREYAKDLDARDAWHAKTIGGTLLYGLPMYAVEVGEARDGSGGSAGQARRRKAVQKRKRPSIARR